jgi:HAD superfamily hydrolase (TIGR01549 family)
MSSLQVVETSPSVPVRETDRPTLIFDFDGTLADTFPAIIEMVNDHAEEFHIQPLGERDVEALRGLSNMEIIRKYNIPLTKVPGLILRSQKELHRRLGDVDLFPGIRELVRELKDEGFGLGILTSNSRENVQKLLRARDLDIFDFIHSESNLFGKNRALLHLMRVHGLKRDEVVYVGDEMRDIDACRRIQVAIIAVSWGFHRREMLLGRKPDYLVDSPEEIRSIMMG